MKRIQSFTGHFLASGHMDGEGVDSRIENGRLKGFTEGRVSSRTSVIAVLNRRY
jgi:hypothetical protein